MKKQLLALTAITSFLIPNENHGQAPTLSTEASFAHFSSNGAVNNSGHSGITEDVGPACTFGSIYEFGNITERTHDSDAVSILVAD